MHRKQVSYRVIPTTECQIRMKWRIKEDDVRNIQGQSLKSKTFRANAPSVKYFLSLYPNGINNSEANSVKLDVHLDFPKVINITASFSVAIKSASWLLKFTDVNFFMVANGSQGASICTRDELFSLEKKFFVNGIMEIQLEGTLKACGIKRKAPESLSLAQALWEADDKDVHKWILCVKSSVFKAELNSGMKEALENKITIIDFSFETVEIVLHYCYERDFYNLITEENASELLHFADKYNIELLHHTIQIALFRKIGIGTANVVKFANMSVTSNAHELQEDCVCFLLNAIKNQTPVDDIDDLKDEIACELGRRSFLSVSK
uniref:BTB domain-containing protein n=1 Tax=Panagrolaimus sp. PS1159 TaxID=55785 RepID=A0AC35G5Y6_9BILA